MIERDARYWELHKQFWIESFDELHKAVQEQITENPHCREAQLLENQVTKMVADALAAEGRVALDVGYP